MKAILRINGIEWKMIEVQELREIKVPVMLPVGVQHKYEELSPMQLHTSPVMVFNFRKHLDRNIAIYDLVEIKE